MSGDNTTAVVSEAFRSLVRALTAWPENPWREPLNRMLWGRWWWFSLAILLTAGAAVSVYLPPLARICGFFPPLIGFTFLPYEVTQLLWSAPTVVAIIAASRGRHLRTIGAERFPELANNRDSREAAFQAVMIPMVVFAILLGLSVAGAQFILNDNPTISSALRIAASSVAIFAIVAGIGVSRRSFGSAFGVLISAGFSWWCAHLVAGFVGPFAVSWWHYLPIEWLHAPGNAIPQLAHVGIDLGVGLIAWSKLSELCAEDRFWIDEPEPELPPIPIVAEEKDSPEQPKG